MIDYFLLFSNQAAAQADATVGATYFAGGNWDQSRVFLNIAVVTPQAIINGVSSITGFWIIVASAVDLPALDAHPQLVMKLDRTIALKGGSFVDAAVITGTNRTNLTFAPVPAGSGYPQPLGQ